MLYTKFCVNFESFDKNIKKKNKILPYLFVNRCSLKNWVVSFIYKSISDCEQKYLGQIEQKTTIYCPGFFRYIFLN